MVFTLWVDNDVSMHKVVGLVVLIPTSPRSSKSESGRKRYHCFRKHVFLLARLLVDRPPHRPTRHHARRRRVSHRLAQCRPALVLVATGQIPEGARSPPGVSPGFCRAGPAPRPACQPSRQDARKLSDLPQTVIFLLAIKGAFSPTVF